MNIKRICFILLLLVVNTHLLNAQKREVTFPQETLKMNQLNLGTHQYLVYMTDERESILAFSSLWTRTTSVEKIGSEDRLVVKQQWVGSDTTFNRSVYSISSAKNFAPIYHRTEMKEKIEAFNFKGNDIYGADSVSNNTKNDFSISSEAPAYNWELDLEVFQTLPYKLGDVYSIMFHHPGSKSIGYSKYTVKGEETIEGYANKKHDCWLLFIEYGPESNATFWVDKGNFLVLKMVEFYKKRKRIKVLLSTPIVSKQN